MEFDEAYLSDLIDSYKQQLKSKGKKDAFLDVAMSQATKYITRKNYLHFGAYWWPLKDLLKRRDVSFYGNNMDNIQLASLKQKTDELTIMAAFEYRDHYLGNMIVGSREFTLANGESYVLYDEDMEEID